MPYILQDSQAFQLLPHHPYFHAQLALCISSSDAPILCPFLASLELRISHQPKPYTSNSPLNIFSNPELQIPLKTGSPSALHTLVSQSREVEEVVFLTSLRHFSILIFLKIQPITPPCGSHMLIPALLPFISRRFQLLVVTLFNTLFAIIVSNFK